MNCFKNKYLLLLANSLIQNIPKPCNAKEHYPFFNRKKNRKSEKITYQPKTFHIVDIKSIITGH